MLVNRNAFAEIASTVAAIGNELGTETKFN